MRIAVMKHKSRAKFQTKQRSWLTDETRGIPQLLVANLPTCWQMVSCMNTGLASPDWIWRKVFLHQGPLRLCRVMTKVPSEWDRAQLGAERKRMQRCEPPVAFRNHMVQQWKASQPVIKPLATPTPPSQAPEVTSTNTPHEEAGAKLWLTYCI